MNLTDKKILTGRQEVKDYPYGRLRTSMFYELEFNPKKGYRSVRQSINPKTSRLNKPKKSTYSFFMFMYENTTNGHIEFFNISTLGELKKFKALYSDIVKNKLKLTKEENSYLVSSYVAYIKIEASAKLQYSFNTYNMSGETKERQKDIKFIHEHQKETFLYLLDKYNLKGALKVYKENGTVKELVKTIPKDIEKGTSEKDVVKYLKSNKIKRGTKVATVKASPKKSAKTKTVKKATKKKVMSKVKTESKGNRVSEKVLRASSKPNDKVLYVVLRMKKLVVAQMQENAVKGKKTADEVKKIVRAFSNQMSGISAGIKDAKIEELKAIATKLKTVVKDINDAKYNANMKDIFSELAENYPQPTREAKKFSIEKDFLDF